MKHCKDCKWWERWGDESSMVEGHWWGYCQLVTTDCGHSQYEDKSLAFTEGNRDDDVTRLFCRDDFGCVMFEPSKGYSPKPRSLTPGIGW